MSLANGAEASLLDLILKNTTWANVGDATGIVGSSTAGSLYISLHSSDPGETGDQTTNEISYTGYARVAISRAGASWNSNGNTNRTNAAAVTFGACTAGSATATHFSVGTASSGAGIRIVSGALTASLAISAGVTPVFAIDQLTVSAD